MSDSEETALEKAADGQPERVTVDGVTITYRKADDLDKADKAKRNREINPFLVLFGNTRKITR